MSGTLYLVSTPIGNLEDITLRALRVLKKVDLIAAEDTRHTKKLLTHYHIITSLTSYFEHNKISKGLYLKKLLAQDKNIALVTDAGTPGISDPGEKIVKDCIKTGIRVESIPGPSALTACLSISGLATDKFYFQGFLPKKKKEKTDVLKRLSDSTGTLIFYESPYRVKATLKNMYDVFGPRETVVVRELTKLYEEVKRGKLDEIACDSSLKEKGEFCIIVAGRKSSLKRGGTKNIEEEFMSQEKIKLLVMKLQKQKGISLKEAIRIIAKEKNLSRRGLYQLVIKK